MARNVAEQIAQDRVMHLVGRNPNLGRTLLGLTKLFARICDETGTAPEGLRFRVPHLDGRGRLSIRYRLGSRGRFPYRGAFGLDAMEWLHASNVAAAKFLGRCRSWRSTIDGVYDRGARFAADHETTFEDTDYALGKVNEEERIAWLHVYASTADRNRAELAAARR